ncbi:MAG TPA: nucleic acid-binding protein [Blastocatellia bacterium]|nr:nucleic acid-binding protein [Blastocatellia bacterium]
MKAVFADTIYWVALINPKDQWHGPAHSAIAFLHDVRLVTTDVILIEVLNFFAEHGEEARFRAVSATEEILTNPDAEVVRHTHEGFLAGFALYKARADKGYSLTDCISMNAMRERNITEVLTHDKHFAQEGFTILF